MVALDTAPAPGTDAAPETPPTEPGPSRVRVAAYALWVVVGTLLTYGVVQTATKAAALLS